MESLIEKQWKEFQEKFPYENVPNIDDDYLKNELIKDLSFVSSMTVEEYILYQKWEEIQNRYPTHNVCTLYGYEKQLINLEQEKLIQRVKNNIWIPDSLDDYLNLEPTFEYTDDSEEIVEESVFGGKSTTSKDRNKELPEIWNTIRTFTSTMKNNSNIGRNLNFIVKDKITGKYLGVTCISGDFLDLTPRDNWIGWNRKEKTDGMINHTAIGSSIVPTQPLGFNYMGGKLLALLCLSNNVQEKWKEKYKDVLVGVTTTSLYGKSKQGGLSQYDRLSHWKKMGYSSGSVSYHPRKETQYLLRSWLHKKNPYKFFEWYVAKRENGQPYKRDHRNRSFNYVYNQLQIPKELIKADHHRGIYFSPLYENTKDFLCGKIDESKLKTNIDFSEEYLYTLWKDKYAKKRITRLKETDRVSGETLFYDDLIYKTWEETKNKYLTQVGR